jgi:threonine dehydrogenase-like Zn-dependent dehydrogenase
MAEFLKVPIDSLMKLPVTMPAQIGALIEPLAVAVHGATRTSLRGVDLAVVLGAGPIGLLTALVVQSQGVPNVLISDVVPTRLELAKSLGLRAFKSGPQLLGEVNKLSDSNGADVLFECAGHPTAAQEMTTLVRSRATIINLGVFKKPVEVDMQAINFKEIQLLGSRVYERNDFQTAIDLAMTLPLEQIISHSFNLSEVSRAFEQFQSSEACKVLILPQQLPK